LGAIIDCHSFCLLHHHSMEEYFRPLDYGDAASLLRLPDRLSPRLMQSNATGERDITDCQVKFSCCACYVLRSAVAPVTRSLSPRTRKPRTSKNKNALCARCYSGNGGGRRW
jgi:hypothetical protein